MQHPEHVEARFETFRDELETALGSMRVPSMAIASALFDRQQVIGGESFVGRQTDTSEFQAFTAAEFITLLGYIEARCAILRKDSHSIFGADLSEHVEREKQSHLVAWGY